MGAMKVLAISALCLVASALAVPVDPYAAPHKEVSKPYNYAYGVSDPYEGLNFGQSETSDGEVVEGSYTVQLSDGRTQIVTYQADHHNGYHAQVEYKGEAQYAPKSEHPPFVVKQTGGYGPV